MKFIKALGFAAIAAVAVMAFVGATSASATSTQLCTAHTSLTCSSGASEIHLTNQVASVVRLLSSLATILCLTALMSGTPLALGSPQSVHTTVLTFEKCGTNGTHTNCEVEALEGHEPLFTLLKTGLDEGSLSAVSGLIHVVCKNIGGFIDIDCEYDVTGLLSSAGAQHFTANKTPINEIEPEDPLCPDAPTFDWLMKTLTNTYVLS